MIYLHYRACDGYSQTQECETLNGARLWAYHWVGQFPDKGHHYAVSQDGIGTVSVTGASLNDLFPDDGRFVFVVKTLDSHECFGPFASYKAAYMHLYHNQQAAFMIEIQEI